MSLHMLLRNHTRFHIQVNLVMFAELWKIFTLSTHATGIYASVAGHGCISILSSTRGNVTLNIVMGPSVRMTLQRRRSCGESGPFVGIGDVIGLFVGIGPVVGIGLFWGTGLVVSLTSL